MVFQNVFLSGSFLILFRGRRCNRTWFVQQRERLLASVADSSVPSVLNLNCQRTFKKPFVIGRRVCILIALNGENG